MCLLCILWVHVPISHSHVGMHAWLSMPTQLGGLAGLPTEVHPNVSICSWITLHIVSIICWCVVIIVLPHRIFFHIQMQSLQAAWSQLLPLALHQFHMSHVDVILYDMEECCILRKQRLPVVLGVTMVVWVLGYLTSHQCLNREAELLPLGLKSLVFQSSQMLRPLSNTTVPTRSVKPNLTSSSAWEERL